MPVMTSTSSSRSTRGSSDGFSIVELLVALTVFSLIGAASLALATSARKVFEQDRNRTAVNQNLRSGIDLLGIDVRQAGERMPGKGPAIDITNGASGAPDTLTLRRNLLDYVLPVCKNVNSTSAKDVVFVAKKGGGSVPPGCSPVPDSNGDGWPDNIEAWRNYRIANGGSVLAYIYNPVTHTGEFFHYDDEDNSDFHIHRANLENWHNDYPVSQQPSIYIIEQKQFRMSGDLLQYIVDDDTDHPVNLVNRLTDFQCRALLDDGTIVDTLPMGTDWSHLQSVEVKLVGSATFSGRTLRRTLMSRFFPRNILSNQ
jgi:prepilin-type N-terminal cleavage/methylation domain-containing protein